MTSSVIVVAATVFIVANAAKMPSTWKTCKRSLPPAEYEPCIQNALEGAIDDLTNNGAPSLGVPPMDPLKITALDISQGTGPVAVNLKFKDLEIGNFKTFEITNIRHKDAENYKFGADIHLKKPLTVKAKYELEGKVLVLPVKGKGDCELQLDNVRASMDLNGQPSKKGDEIYMDVTGFDVKFDTDKLHLKFENLFDGQKELGDNMNVFLNENWEVILKELRPAVVEALSQAFKAFSNQIFRKIPYNKIIPA